MRFNSSTCLSDLLDSFLTRFLCLFPLVVYSPHVSLHHICSVSFSLSLSLSLSLSAPSLLSLSSPLASAVLLYLRHSGIKLRDSKGFPGLSTEKEKWLAFLKTKKVRVATALLGPTKKNSKCTRQVVNTLATVNIGICFVCQIVCIF